MWFLDCFQRGMWPFKRFLIAGYYSVAVIVVQGCTTNIVVVSIERVASSSTFQSPKCIRSVLAVTWTRLDANQLSQPLVFGSNASDPTFSMRNEITRSPPRRTMRLAAWHAGGQKIKPNQSTEQTCIQLVGNRVSRGAAMGLSARDRFRPGARAPSDVSV